MAAQGGGEDVARVELVAGGGFATAVVDAGRVERFDIDTDLTVTSDHSLVTADLTRSLQGAFSSPAESSAVSVTIHNVESVDFCPDASGAVPFDIQSDFSMSAGTTTVQFQKVTSRFTVR